MFADDDPVLANDDPLRIGMHLHGTADCGGEYETLFAIGSRTMVE